MYGLREQAEYMNAPADEDHVQNHLRPRGRLYMKLSTKPFCIGLPGAI